MTAPCRYNAFPGQIVQKAAKPGSDGLLDLILCILLISHITAIQAFCTATSLLIHLVSPLCTRQVTKRKGKAKGHTLDTAPISEGTSLQERSSMAHIVKEFHFFLHNHAFIHEWNEPYLPLPSQSKLVLIHQPKKGWKAELP